VTAM